VRPVYLEGFAAWSDLGAKTGPTAGPGPAPRAGPPGILAPWPEAPPLGVLHPRARKPHRSGQVLVQLASTLTRQLAPEQRRGCGLIVGSAAGCAVADHEFQSGLDQRGLPFGSPSVFVYTLPTAPLGEVSIALGIEGPLCTVSAGGASGLAAIARAAAEVANGDLEHALCGAMELGALADGRRAVAGADHLVLLLLAARPARWRLWAWGAGFQPGGTPSAATALQLVQALGVSEQRIAVRAQCADGCWAEVEAGIV
jgi:Beta-ketoacyl synthase, N-terminal domain